LALTFGTLLSSQGADAHPSQPVGRTGGNPSNATRSGSRCQSRPSRPIGPVGLGPAPSGADERPLSAAECTAPSAGDQSGIAPGRPTAGFPCRLSGSPRAKTKLRVDGRQRKCGGQGLPGRRPRRSGPPAEMNPQRRRRRGRHADHVRSDARRSTARAAPVTGWSAVGFAGPHHCTSSAPAIARLPRRSTSNRPCSRSSSAG
jgi:hypothetical protein